MNYLVALFFWDLRPERRYLGEPGAPGLSGGILRLAGFLSICYNWLILHGLLVKILILSGLSGCGKTTTWSPGLAKRLNAVEFDTGDLFKSQLGYQRLVASGASASKPESLKLGDNALREFLNSGRAIAGLEEYDRLKVSGELTGYEIIEHIETLRAIQANLPALATHRIHELICPHRLCITTAINNEELDYLIDCYGEKGSAVLLRLKCLEELKERVGDNRTSCITDRIPCIEVSYSWGTVEEIMDEVATYLGAYYV